MRRLPRFQPAEWRISLRNWLLRLLANGQPVLLNVTIVTDCELVDFDNGYAYNFKLRVAVPRYSKYVANAVFIYNQYAKGP